MKKIILIISLLIISAISIVWATTQYTQWSLTPSSSNTPVEMMRLDNGGTDRTAQLGIGTNAPASMLHLSSTAPTFRMTDTTASAKSLLLTVDANAATFSEVGGAATNLMVMDLANARIGVGGANASAGRMDIFTSGTGTAFNNNAVLSLRSTASGRASTLQFSDGTNAVGYVSYLNGGAAPRLGIGFDTIGEIFSVVNSGKIGMAGVTAPVAYLDISKSTNGSEGTNNNLLAVDRTYTGNVNFDNNICGLSMSWNNSTITGYQYGVQGSLIFQGTTNSTGGNLITNFYARPYWQGSGNFANVHCYVADPYIINASGTTTTYVGFRANPFTVNGTTPTFTNVYQFLASNPANATVTNAYGLYVTDITAGGTLNYAIYTNAGAVRLGGAVQMANYGAGTATFDASGNISSVSDERFKDIQGNFTAGLKEILNLNPILYKYNKDSGLDQLNTYAGFSAQNVMKYIPEAVGKNNDEYYSLSDRPIIAALVNAIKEQQKEINELRAELKLSPKDYSVVEITNEDRIIKSKPVENK